jgi:hypothetical protein
VDVVLLAAKTNLQCASAEEAELNIGIVPGCVVDIPAPLEKPGCSRKYGKGPVFLQIDVSCLPVYHTYLTI